MQGKTLLVVNTGYIKKKFIFKKLKQLGVKIVCLNSKINWAQDYVDDWIVANTSNHDRSISKVKEYIKKSGNQIDGVITFWEDDVLLTSKLVDELKLIGIPHRIAERTRNKFKFRAFCEANGLPTPNHIQVNNRNELVNIQKKLKFPIVFKPAYGTLTALIVKVNTAKDLEKEYDYISKNTSTEMETALNDGLDIFAEEYIDGDEVDIDMIIQNGKLKLAIVSDNFEKNRGKFFLDVGQATPSNLPQEQQQELIDMAEMVLEKLGIFNGCVHFEAKYSSKGPVPLESNLRMGGDYVYSYIKSAWDVDLIELAVKVALGVHINPIKNLKNKKYVIGRDLSVEDSGIVNEFSLPDNFEKYPFLEDHMFYKELGDSIMVPPEGFETFGWVTVSGQSFPDATDNLNSLLKEIDISVAKFDYESYAGKISQRDASIARILEARQFLKIKERVNYLSATELKKLDIGVICNWDKTDKQSVELMQSDLQNLNKLGYNFVSLTPDPRALLGELDTKGIDIVLPLLKYDQRSAVNIIKAIEISGIPFVGSQSSTLELLNNRITLRKLFTFNEIPMPQWDYIYEAGQELDEEIEFPVKVRSALLTGKQVRMIAKDYKALEQETNKLLNQTFNPILVEEYYGKNTKSAQIIFAGNTQQSLDIWSLVVRDNQSQKIVKVNDKIKSLIVEIASDIFYYSKAEDFLSVNLILDEDNNPFFTNVKTDIEPCYQIQGSLQDLYITLIKSAIAKYQQLSNTGKL